MTRVREEDKERNVGKRRKQLTEPGPGNMKMFCYLNICLHNLNGSFGTQGGPGESVALCLSW